MAAPAYRGLNLPLFTMNEKATEAFRILAGFEPMRWQQRLLEMLLRGEVPTAVALPTGLGKTSVMALWLIARAFGAPLPRRLVYVVDRRVVVAITIARPESVTYWLLAGPRIDSQHGDQRPAATYCAD